MTTTPRTPAKKKARELAKYLPHEHPDYAYLKEVFRQLRAELELSVPGPSRRLPRVPTDAEIRRYYEVVWQTRKMADLVLIKLLLYTAVRVSELIMIKLADVDVDRCQIRITAGKGKKDRVVPFPSTFKEALALHMAAMKSKGASYLFESSWKRRYSDRGVRKLLARYAAAAGLDQTISPHMLRHYLLTWLKKQGVDDALIQPYSARQSAIAGNVFAASDRRGSGGIQRGHSEVSCVSSGAAGSTLGAEGVTLRFTEASLTLGLVGNRSL